MKKLLFFVVMFTTYYSSNAFASLSLSIPIVNSGAEAGNLNGWSGYGYRNVNNRVNAHSGSHYFGLDTSLLTVGSNDTSSLDTYYAGLQTNIDLSGYLGRIEKLSVSSWYKGSDLVLKLESSTTGSMLSYRLEQEIGMRTTDIYGNVQFPTGFGTFQSDVWTERTGDLSFWENWGTQKGEIAAVTISLDTQFRNVDSNGPELYDIDISSFDNVFFEWASTKYPAFNTSTDLSTFQDSEDLPVIGFDDVTLNLELAPVPLPSAIWLFLSATITLGSMRRKA